MPVAHPIIIQNSERLDRLYKLGLLDADGVPQLEPAFDRLTGMAARLLNMPVALVTLVEGDRQVFLSQAGLPEPWASSRQTPLSHSFCQHAVASQSPLVIEDTRLSPLGVDNLAIEALGVVAYAGIPLVTSDGFALGTFCVIDHAPHQWTEDELTTLTDLAAAVMTEIELRSELYARRQNENLLRDSQRNLQHSLDELRALYEKVSELEQLKTDMIRLAAHDLRSPLLSVLGFTEIMMEDARSIPEEYLPFVNLIHQSGEHMLQIINDILCLQRIEASHDFDSLEAVNLTALVTEACVLFEQMAQQDGQGLRLVVSPAPVMVKGEPAQLREAINNLISNGLKYSASDGSITVRLSQDTEDGVSFEVEDTGIGIAEEAQSQLFEPFYRVRTRETATIPGTGLGLALVKRIIERHTGHIHFISREGVGSTFGFWLPIVQAEAELALVSA